MEVPIKEELVQGEETRSLQFVANPGYFLHRLSGDVYLQEVFERGALMESDENYFTGVHVLWDLSGARFMDGTSEQLYQERRRIGDDKRAGSVSAVVVSDVITYGQVRMFYSIFLDEKRDFNIFYTFEEAEAWLTEKICS